MRFCHLAVCVCVSVWLKLHCCDEQDVACAAAKLGHNTVTTFACVYVRRAHIHTFVYFLQILVNRYVCNNSI